MSRNLVSIDAYEKKRIMEMVTKCYFYNQVLPLILLLCIVKCLMRLIKQVFTISIRNVLLKRRVKMVRFVNNVVLLTLLAIFFFFVNV